MSSKIILQSIFKLQIFAHCWKLRQNPRFPLRAWSTVGVTVSSPFVWYAIRNGVIVANTKMNMKKTHLMSYCKEQAITINLKIEFTANCDWCTGYRPRIESLSAETIESHVRYKKSWIYRIESARNNQEIVVAIGAGSLTDSTSRWCVISHANTKG